MPLVIHSIGRVAIRLLRVVGLALCFLALLVFLIGAALSAGWLIGWIGGEVTSMSINKSWGLGTLANDFGTALHTQLSGARGLARTLWTQLQGLLSPV